MDSRKKVGEFAVEVLKAFNDIKADESNFYLPIQMESAISSKRLKEILENLSASSEEASEKSLSPLIVFLKEREEALIGLRASPTFVPDSKINQVSNLLDQKLTELFEKPSYTYLFPSVRFPLGFNLKLHQFLISNTKQYIVVGESFAIAAEAANKIKSEIKAAEAENNNIDVPKTVGKESIPKLYFVYSKHALSVLSEAEQDLLINHSAESLHCYESINLYLNYQESPNDSLVVYDDNFLYKMIRQFQLELTSSQYDYKVKLARSSNRFSWQTCVEDKRLIAYAANNIRNKHELAECLLYFSPDQWKGVLSSINEKQFHQLVLEGRSFSSAFRRCNFTDNETFDKALLYSFVTVYRQLLPTEVAGYAGYSKDDKDLAAEALLDFLSSASSLSEFEAYFNHPERKKFKGALHNSRLGEITTAIIQLSKQLKKEGVISESQTAITQSASVDTWSGFFSKSLSIVPGTTSLKKLNPFG